jgi:hypothetical protein
MVWIFENVFDKSDIVVICDYTELLSKFEINL